jgi:hypothetical protein
LDPLIAYAQSQWERHTIAARARARESLSPRCPNQYLARTGAGDLGHRR